MSLADGFDWIKQLSRQLQAAFGKRLLFVGLQGSYARGEATDKSDLDAVVVLDTLSIADLATYKNLLAKLPHREKACGFISGQAELKNWPRQELFQFKNDTLSIYGSLEEILPPITRQDALDAVKTGASAIYHIFCHTYLHGNLQGMLPALCKNAFFVLQAQYYLQTGQYISSKRKLLPLLNPREQVILKAALDFSAPGPDSYLEKHLFNWCQTILSSPQRD